MIRAAPELSADRLPAPPVAQLDWTAGLVKPPITPLHQRGEHGEEVSSLFRESVMLARALAGLAVVLALQQPVRDQLTQPCGRYGLADLSALREVVEASGAIERLPEDQEGRARADNVERPGEGAPIGRPVVPGVQKASHPYSMFHACIIADFCVSKPA